MALRHDRSTALLLLILGLLLGSAVAADEAPSNRAMRVPESIDDQLADLREEGNGREPAPLWDWRDPTLDRQVRAAFGRLGLSKAAKKGRLGAVLVILDPGKKPRVAAVNPDLALYAASLPKIAILLGAFDRIDKGKLKFNKENEDLMGQMLRRSSNSAATEMIRRVGIENIARTLLDDRYRLYDPNHNGGLWVGQEYGKGGRWRRDPINNLSHGATAMQVARFYYMLEKGQLVSRVHSRSMKKLLSGTALAHKFAKSVLELHPRAVFYRKSGSWRTFHSDGVLVKADGKTYIATALIDDPNGALWLEEILEAFDRIVFQR